MGLLINRWRFGPGFVNSGNPGSRGILKRSGPIFSYWKLNTSGKTTTTIHAHTAYTGR